MMKIEAVNRLFDKYGQDVVIEINAERYEDTAFVQLMRYKNKIYLDLPVGEIGTRENGSYLYIGKPCYDLSKQTDNVKIYSEGFLHYVKRAQTIYCAGKPLYTWAVLYRTVKDGEYEKF